MRLTAAARTITADFYRETEARIADGGDLAWYRSMVTKMRVHLFSELPRFKARQGAGHSTVATHRERSSCGALHNRPPA